MKLQSKNFALVTGFFILVAGFSQSSSGDVIFSGDLGSGLTVSITEPVSLTVDQTKNINTVFLGFQDVYSTAQDFLFQTTSPQPLTLTLNAGTPVSATSFLHSNVVGEVSPTDFFIGFEFADTVVNVGDTFTLSMGFATSDPDFKIPDAVGDFVNIDLYDNSDGITFTSGATLTVVPEPSCAVLSIVACTLLFVVRRRLT